MSLVTDAPATDLTHTGSRTARVAVVRTRPDTVIEDYGRVMDLAGYRDVLSRDRDTLVKRSTCRGRSISPRAHRRRARSTAW
jgi:hypothetical protein